jgi:hypothetical protein
MKLTDIKQSDLPIRVRLTDGFTLEESYDIGSIIQINSFKPEDEYDTGGWCYEVYTTVLKDDVEYNKTISKRDWYDGNGGFTSNWYESNSKKMNQDGSYRDTIYVMEGDDFCEIVAQEKNSVVEYLIEDFEEPITKQELKTLKKFLGEFTLKTNAGLELHSSEVKDGKWNGITITKVKFQSV